jgi:hypothetical protein
MRPDVFHKTCPHAAHRAHLLLRSPLFPITTALTTAHPAPANPARLMILFRFLFSIIHSLTLTSALTVNPTPAYAACTIPAGPHARRRASKKICAASGTGARAHLLKRLLPARLMPLGSRGLFPITHPLRALLLLLSLITIISAHPTPARAACTSPAGSEGHWLYNYPYHVMTYCNGTNWMATGKVSGSGDITDAVGWWKLDDGSGSSATDSSGNGNTGTLQNSPTWLAGKLGGALSFNGSNQYVDIGNPSDLRITGSLTITAWVNGTSYAGDNVVLSKWAAAGNRSYDLRISVTDCGAADVEFLLSDDGSSPETLCGTTAIGTGGWHFIAAVYDPSTPAMKIYVDGALNGTNTVNPPLSLYNGTQNVNMGRKSDASGYFNGALDDVRIYNRALSASEIAQIYNYNPLSRTAKGTISSNANSLTTTLTSVPLNAGDRLIVAAVANSTGISSLTWGGTNLTQDSAFIQGTLHAEVWSLYTAAGGTGDIVLTTSSKNHDRAFSATAVTGLQNPAIDWSAAAGGSSTTPSSGATGTTNVANEYLYGAIGSAASLGGTWSNSFTDGQSAGIGAAWINEGYKTVSATGAYTAAKTGTASTTWAANIATYKAAAGSCHNPTGNEGEFLYNYPYHVMTYCDGNSWQAMGQNPGAGTSGGGQRTALGTAYSTALTATITNVTLAAGDTLLVGATVDGGNATGVTWNGIALNEDNAGPSAGSGTSIWSKYITTGGTGDIVVTGDRAQSTLVVASKVSGLISAPFDKAANATGTGTAPSSGATATTTAANEFLYGLTAYSYPAAGAWSNSFTAGQSANDGSFDVLDEGYKTVSATGAYTAAKTGVTNTTGWTALIATYKINAITRTAKGTCSTLTATSCTISSVALNTGDTLIVGVSNNQASSPVTATWNGISMTQDAFTSDGGGSLGEAYVFRLSNVTGATGNVVITQSVGGNAMAVWASAVSGLATSNALDQTAGAFGNGTTPSSGATPATTSGNEICFGNIAEWNGTSSVGGTWLNSFTDGQAIGAQSGTNTTAVDEGYLILSSTQAVTASKTGATGTDWDAQAVCYKGAAQSTCINPSGAEGEWFYNYAYHTYQYCDGTYWRKTGY